MGCSKATPEQDGALGTEWQHQGQAGILPRPAVGRGGRGRQPLPPACITSLWGSHLRPAGPGALLSVIRRPEHSRRPVNKVQVETHDTNCALVFKVRFGAQRPGQSTPPTPTNHLPSRPCVWTQHRETGNFPSQPGTLARMRTLWRPGHHPSDPVSVLSSPRIPKHQTSLPSRPHCPGPLCLWGHHFRGLWPSTHILSHILQPRVAHTVSCTRGCTGR